MHCRYLKGELDNSPVPLDDTFRSYNGASADGTTFPGKPGKIDYVMVDAGAAVKNAWIGECPAQSLSDIETPGGVC